MENDERQYCPVCNLGNDLDSKVCIFCGSDLIAPPSSIRSTETLGQAPTELPKTSVIRHVAMIPRGAIAFYLMDSANPFAVATGSEIILGRLQKDLKYEVVDLSSHDALSLGVSRRHAKVRRKGEGFEVVDLESTNGTSLNEKRMAPLEPFDLHSGDIIWLARLPIRVEFLASTQDMYMPGGSRPI